MRYYEFGLGLFAIGFVLQPLLSLLLQQLSGFPWAKYSRPAAAERMRLIPLTQVSPDVVC
jgi:hypothetical protein